MCGIVGYIGTRDVSGILVDGLKRLEYRGYDSCGVAIVEHGESRVVRSVGRIGTLEEKLRSAPSAFNGNGGIRYGIGHTRWATHGRPSEDNAHPHTDCSGRFYVAHNGIIENYIEIRRRLMSYGHRFVTATDTEVLPHLIETLFVVFLKNGEMAVISPENAFLGRGVQYPIAMEGALKLKEVSYIHSEGYTAGEMKHGPIALIDSEMPVVVLAPKDSVYRKTMSNVEEVKARDGIVVAIATEGDKEIQDKADHAIFIPEAGEFTYPILTAVPLQLLAYHTALLRECDVDKPRNLAKSVTVE